MVERIPVRTGWCWVFAAAGCCVLAITVKNDMSRSAAASVPLDERTLESLVGTDCQADGLGGTDCKATTTDCDKTGGTACASYLHSYCDYDPPNMCKMVTTDDQGICNGVYQFFNCYCDEYTGQTCGHLYVSVLPETGCASACGNPPSNCGATRRDCHQ